MRIDEISSILIGLDEFSLFVNQNFNGKVNLIRAKIKRKVRKVGNLVYFTMYMKYIMIVMKTRKLSGI